MSGLGDDTASDARVHTMAPAFLAPGNLEEERMTSGDRKIRSAAGMLAVGLAGAGLGRIEDDRGTRNRRWSVLSLAKGLMVGLVVGLQGFKQLETLTDSLSRGLRDKLGIGRRLSDTTVRDFLVHARLASLQAALHRQVRTALRRKQLEPVGLPCNVVAFDGKTTMTPYDGGPYAQEQSPRRYAMRTMTCTLVSSRAPICIHASPIPKETNEMGHFAAAVREVARAFGRGSMVELVTADAGMTSLENATVVHEELHAGYLFALKGTQSELLAEAERLLAHLPGEQAIARTEETAGGKLERRLLWRTAEMVGYHGWAHLRTVLRVRWETVSKDGTLIAEMERYFVSNEAAGRFTPAQWLAIVRAHWQVENGVHKTLDVAFREDDRPWSRNPAAMLALMILRRIACNAMAIFRAHTLREERRDLIPWRELMDRLRHAVLAAQAHHLAGLRWDEIPEAVTRA